MTRILTTRRALLAGAGIGIAGVATAATSKALRSSLDGEVAVTLLAGEPGSTSIILQARVSSSLAVPGKFDTRSAGLAGRVRFEIAEDRSFKRARRTAWGSARAEDDFIVRKLVQGLSPDTIYFYRAHFSGSDGRRRHPSATGEFKTLPNQQSAEPLSFAVFSCMSYAKFYALGGDDPSVGAAAASAAALAQQRAGSISAEQRKGVAQAGSSLGALQRSRPATEAERLRGYPAMDLIRTARPAFIVATGDTVYYDHGPRELWATTVPQMRHMWHHQFAVPSLRDTLAGSAAFFMKDDHDFRVDDADNTGAALPSAADGRRVFLEQVPVTVQPAPPYRTTRVNRHLQVWMLEGRDFRSPNAMPDGPDKTLWGTEQRKWLEHTLLASDADFKVLISPTPIVGPDDIWKIDNHTSPRGFHYEGEHFLRFLHDNNLNKSTFIVNGDRHWKYHSVHPTGVEELSCGAVHGQNSRLGVAPGDPRGTDPQAKIRQPYRQAKPDGGFLQIDIEPAGPQQPARFLARFWSESGTVDYEVQRTAI